VVAGSYDLTNAGNTDAVVMALDGTGSSLLFATYLGGTETEEARAVVVDAQERVTVTGWTQSDFPVTPGAFDTTKPKHVLNAFVTRLDPDGSQLVYSSYFGGSTLLGATQAIALALTDDGGTIVAGGTSTPDLPVTAGCFQNSLKGLNDGFVARLNADASALEWSTYVGGSDQDGINAAALLSDGDLAVCGTTLSLDFPYTPGAFQTAKGFFVARVKSDGSTLVAAAKLGGTFPTTAGVAPWAITSDALDNIVVGGFTDQEDFPVTPGSLQDFAPPGPVYAGFVTCFDPHLTHLIFSTYLGGFAPGNDVLGLVVGGTGAIVLSGLTNAPSFPTTAGCFDSVLDYWDALVSRLSPDGKQMWYSTLLGGSSTEQDFGVNNHVPLALTPDGGAVIGHWTLS